MPIVKNIVAKSMGNGSKNLTLKLYLRLYLLRGAGVALRAKYSPF